MGEIVSLRTAQLKASRQDVADPAVQERFLALRERRMAWGMGLRHRRQTQGLTTRSLADTIGLSTPTLISAVEAGRGRIPPGVLAGWALAIGMEPAEFAAGYLAAFEPEAYAALRAPATGREQA